MGSKDVLIKGGQVVDGTGKAAFTADVRVRDGRIAEVGPDLAPNGEEIFDATGAYVTPGFIDTHAHTDPAVFWDPALDPEPLHGVTTMLIGNCSLSLFPVNAKTRATISDLFAYIEDVPRHLFDDAVPWDWDDYAGYRDSVNASGTGPNLASMVGHSMLRLVVMGDDAWDRVATPEETETMCGLLDSAMAAGAWGISTSHLDVDADGRPVPSRAAGPEELDALLDVVAKYGRGLCEIVPGLMGDNPMQHMQEMAERCGKRNIPFTWTGFVYSHQLPGRTQMWLDFAAEKKAAGYPIYPQLSPRTLDFRINWESSMMFMTMPKGWHKVIAAPPTGKAAILQSDEWRHTAREEWDEVRASMFPHKSPGYVRIVETHGAENDKWLGKTLADVIEASDKHPSDAFADFVLANDCRPGVVASGMANADEDGMARTWADPNVLVSSSDAGAHMQMLCASGDTTLLLTRYVRERGDFTLEGAIHELTGRQADAFGFNGRGVIAEGNVADLVVFSLDELHYDVDVFVADLPKGGKRMRRPEGGYRATFVDGVAVQRDGKLTGALPGRVISAAD
jgi:N-acyl-D-amino-acid deacylase